MAKIWDNYWMSQMTQIQQCISTWQQVGKAQMKLSSLPSGRQTTLYRRIIVDVHGPVQGGRDCSHLLALAKLVAKMLRPADKVTIHICNTKGQDYLDFS